MEKIKKMALEKFTSAKETVKKFMIMSLIFVVLVVGIFFAYQYVTTEGEEEFTPTEIIDKVTTAKEKPAERKKGKDAKEEKAVAMTIPENPFISSKELSLKVAEKMPGVATQTTMMSQGQPSTPIVLPQIPKTQIQSQPIKLPESRTIVNPLTMETMEIKNEGNVQGVITTDNGKNIAIMSNCEVLTEGERYLDGRIAYIGGDGIEMDNGKKIKLKE